MRIRPGSISRAEVVGGLAHVVLPEIINLGKDDCARSPGTESDVEMGGDLEAFDLCTTMFHSVASKE